MNRLALATVATLAASLASPALATHMASASQDRTTLRMIQLRQHVQTNRHVTWRWQDRLHTGRTHTTRRELRTRSLPFLRWLVHWWHDRAHEAMRSARSYIAVTSDLSAWMCIHGGEGAWNSNTGNGFFGGLQMDYGFMSTYGREYLSRYGTADRWPPAVQIEVARRARDSGRGYYPWPSTARACGLI